MRTGGWRSCWRNRCWTPRRETTFWQETELARGAACRRCGLIAAHGFSQRQACRLLKVDPNTVRRAPTADASEIRQRLRDLADPRRARLPPARHSAGARRDHDQPQEALPALSRGGAAHPASTWPQPGHRHARTDHRPAGAEPALAAQLRRRRLSWGRRFRVSRLWTTSRARRSPWSSTT